MTEPLNIIFAGTPEFSVPCLEALIESEHKIVAVYTQPDRPAGRGRKLTASPVKQLAEQNDLPVFQPESLRDIVEQQMLKALNADLMIVVAYGLILPTGALEAPKQGCINVHASLLPRWRGASPIQHAILAGDKETGITIMQMDEGLDTGPMLNRVACPINEQDTSEDLQNRLAKIGAEALLMSLADLQSGRIQAVKQDKQQATYAGKIKKAAARIDWQQPAVKIDQCVRAYNPWPIAFTEKNSETLRIWRAVYLNEPTDQKPGTITRTGKMGIDVATGDGLLRLLTLQLPGGKPLSSQDLLNSKKEMFAVGVSFS